MSGGDDRGFRPSVVILAYDFRHRRVMGVWTAKYDFR